MDIKRKLFWLELVGGTFGWAWILASVATLIFLAMAVFSNSPWSRFFWAFGIGAIAKWLAKGTRDNQLRVAFQTELMAKCYYRE